MTKHKKHNHAKDKHGGDRHGKDHHGSGHLHSKQKKLIHHDWKFWVAIVLMLMGMGAYMMTLDESVQPAGIELPEVPAAVE